jgi:TolA-binding protein
MAPEVALLEARALDADKQTDAALKAYSVTEERFAKSDQAALAALARARLLVKAGRHLEAARAFERILGDERASARLETANTALDAVLAEWGWALLDSGKAPEADRVFARLLQEYPGSTYAADARFNLAESANLTRNYPEVVRLLKPLADTKAMRRPAAGPPRGVLVAAATRGGATAGAVNDSQRRLLPAVLYRLGRTQVELNDWAAASAILDRLLAEFPDNPYRREARYLRAEAALRGGNAASAEPRFASLLADPPAATDPKGFIQVVRLKRIQCWVALKRWNDVIPGAQALKADLTRDDPAVAELDYARGQAFLGLAQLDQARAAFQAVVDARRGSVLAAQAQLMRGETYFHEDKFHEALREFLKVDILFDAPQCQAAALLEAGKVYERLEQWADAAETYERLLTKFPSDPHAAEARTRLAAARRQAAASTVSKKKS